MSEKHWSSAEDAPESFLGIAGIGILRFALLFGSAAIALALILAPVLENQSRRFAGTYGLDTMSTGSVSPGNGYTLRRSVLQDSPTSICVIHDDGSRSGNCD